MATIAHPTTGELGQRQPASSARAVLERAVDAAPSRIPPARGWLRRLLARDHSARAIIERYGLWPEIEYAYGRISHELGPARVEMTAEEDCGDAYLALDCYVQPGDEDAHLDFEEALRGELRRRGRGQRPRRLRVLIHPDHGN
jgi:hypothetical protein